MSPRRISKSAVFIKVIGPWLWFGALIALGVAELLPLSGMDFWVTLITMVVLLLVSVAAIDEVVADVVDEVLDAGDHLVVRWDGRVERIDIAEIERVDDDTRWGKLRMITLTLRAPHPLGPEISFIPVGPPRGIVGWGTVVGAELEQRAAQARTALLSLRN